MDQIFTDGQGACDEWWKNENLSPSVTVTYMSDHYIWFTCLMHTYGMLVWRPTDLANKGPLCRPNGTFLLMLNNLLEIPNNIHHEHYQFTRSLTLKGKASALHRLITVQLNFPTNCAQTIKCNLTSKIRFQDIFWSTTLHQSKTWSKGHMRQVPTVSIHVYDYRLCWQQCRFPPTRWPVPASLYINYLLHPVLSASAQKQS